MSASNHNYVCFRCRASIRYPKVARNAPRCLSCGEECFNLGYKVEIPKHDDLKAWRHLQAECQRRALANENELVMRRVRRQHFLEKEINRMRQMPLNRDRSRAIKKLGEELVGLDERRMSNQIDSSGPG